MWLFYLNTKLEQRLSTLAYTGFGTEPTGTKSNVRRCRGLRKNFRQLFIVKVIVLFQFSVCIGAIQREFFYEDNNTWIEVDTDKYNFLSTLFLPTFSYEKLISVKSPIPKLPTQRLIRHLLDIIVKYIISIVCIEWNAELPIIDICKTCLWNLNKTSFLATQIPNNILSPFLHRLQFIKHMGCMSEPCYFLNI